MVQFQKDAQEALDAETPDSEKLEQLIEFSVTLDVDLPEIPKLKQVSVKQDSGDCFSILIFYRFSLNNFYFSLDFWS